MDAILECYHQGQYNFGENYAQHFRDKSKALADYNIKWHFIGHLQRNKIKYIVPHVSLFHALDSHTLADHINKITQLPIHCLIEINIASELSKTGVFPDRVAALIQHCQTLPNVHVQGLMCIPPLDKNKENTRFFFRQLYHLKEQLNQTICQTNPLIHLSMGMSQDFEIAIEEGATIIRVGTAIFGERLPKGHI